MVEKFHWTFEYVMWGISFTNLQMLLADSREYFPDFSHTGGKQEKEEEVINGDDPNNRDRMRHLLGWDK